MSRKISFIDTVVRNLPLPDKRITYWCEGCPAFGLRVTPNGTKTFIYKYMSGRASRQITIGKYPEVSIREARSKYNELYQQVNDYGRDPLYELKLKSEIESHRVKVCDLVDGYKERELLKGKKSISEEIRAIRSNILPIIGDKYFDAVTAHDIDDIQTNIIERAKRKSNSKRDGRVSVRKTLVYARNLFNYGKNKKGLKEYLENTGWSNPIESVQSLGVQGKRDRVLTFKEVWTFWHGIENVGLPVVTAKTLKFILTSMQRGVEVRNMRYSSVKEGEGVWEMEYSETKNSTMHRVPLNKYSKEIIAQTSIFTGNSSYVFGAMKNQTPPKILPANLVPFSEGTLSQALSRNRIELGIEDICPHDLRGTGPTWITSVGLSKLCSRLILNHNDGDTTATSAYVQYSYDHEKKLASSVWEFILDQILSSPDVDSIPSLDDMRQLVLEANLIQTTQTNHTW